MLSPTIRLQHSKSNKKIFSDKFFKKQFLKEILKTHWHIFHHWLKFLAKEFSVLISTTFLLNYKTGLKEAQFGFFQTSPTIIVSNYVKIINSSTYFSYHENI